jgi:hypothetical protein
MKIISKIATILILLGSVQCACAASKYDYATAAIGEAASTGNVGYWSVGEPKYQAEIINNVKYVVADISQISNNNEMFLSIETTQGRFEPVARIELGNAPYPLIAIHNGVVSITTTEAHHGTYSTEYRFKLRASKFRLISVRDFSDDDDDYGITSAETIRLLLIDFSNHQAKIWIKQFKFGKTNQPGDPVFDAWSHVLSHYRKTSTLPFPSCATIKVPSNDFDLDGFDLDKLDQWLSTHARKKSNCQSRKVTSNSSFEADGYAAAQFQR